MRHGGLRPDEASCSVVAGPSEWHHDFLEARRMTRVQIRPVDGTMEQGLDTVGKPDSKTER